MINWEAIFAKYKEVSVFYKLKQGSNEVAAFDKAVAEFYTKVYDLQDVKKQLRYFFDTIHIIGDNHSFIIPDKESGFSSSIFSQQFSDMIIRVSKIDSITVLKVPGVFFEEVSSYEEYLKYHYDFFENYFINCDCSKLIIDLRGNHGGNMWAMIGAINFLFNKKVLGHFYSNSRIEDWVFWDKNLLSGNTLELKIYEKNSFRFNGKIAVLIDSETGSSGEALAIALLSATKDIHFFGTKTAGYTTGNEEYLFACGTRLWVAECFFQDVNGTIYSSGIYPHIECGNEESIAKALAWLIKD